MQPDIAVDAPGRAYVLPHEKDPMSARGNVSLPARLLASIAVLLSCVLAGPGALAGSGQLDPSYGEAGVRRLPGTSGSIVVDSMGRLYRLGQDTPSCNDGDCGFVTRVTEAGLIDTSFGASGRATLHRPLTSYLAYSHLRPLPDGKMLYLSIGYTFACRLCNDALSVRRLDIDGSLDTTFTAPAIADKRDSGADAYALLEVYPDGRFLFGSYSELRRYLPDGTPDGSFQPLQVMASQPLSSHWRFAATYADGSAILIGQLGGVSSLHHPMFRLNPDGTRDMAFGSGTGEVRILAPDGGNVTIHGLLAQPDGKVLVAAHVRPADSSLHHAEVRRYLASGQLDTGFGNGGITRLPLTTVNVPEHQRSDVGVFGYPMAMALQADGKVVVAGTDNSAGFRRIFATRLRTNGEIDDSFAVRENGLVFVDASGGEETAAAVASHPLGVYIGGTVDGPLTSGTFPPAAGAVMRLKTPATYTSPINPAQLPAGGLAAAYSHNINIAGIPAASITWSVAGGTLPPGLAIVGDHLQGTPTQAGRYRFILKAEYFSGNEATQFYALDIHTDTSLIVDYYGSILSRTADSEGVAFWESEVDRVVALGADPNDVLHALSVSFFDSPEYKSRVLADADFVSNLYQAYLARDPDIGGRNYWVGQLQQGLTRGALLNEFLFTAEFESRMARVFGERTSRAETRMVIDFYRGLLGRLPDDAGFQYWIGRFRAAQCSGNVVAEVEAISSLFVSLPEYDARESQNPAGQRTLAYVANLYNAFLRRGGDLPGFQFWAGQINSGARSRDEVRRQFIQSPEFQARVQAVIAQGCGVPNPGA